MKYRLLDLLACPHCKNFPLELIVLEETTYERSCAEEKKPYCELYCGLKRARIQDIENPEQLPCEECVKKEIVEGVLYCSKCGRWYPIRNEIPIMLPDKLRSEKEDIEFLEKYKDKLPEKIVYEGKPFHLPRK